MAMIRKTVAVQIQEMGEREVEIVMSTPELARDGHVLEPQGCVLGNYLKNPIQLWRHDDAYPVGRNDDIRVIPDGIRAKSTFAPPGIFPKADEVCGLVKARIINAVSVGFNVIESEPLDPRKPRGGQRITKWELLECSWVAIPADTGAIVLARTEQEADDMPDWKVGAARDLPIDDSDSWDGPAAEKAVFKWAAKDGEAGGFDSAKARQAFLVYDAEKADERGSYKLPIATVKDGKLVVPKGALRAAASRLPDTDIPEDVKTRAGKVLDAYKKKAKIGDEEGDGERGARAAYRRMFGRPVGTRGLWDVAQLCYAMLNLDWIATAAKVESALEGDASTVPAQLTGVLHAMGDALKAMTEEEIDELLAGQDLDVEDDGDDLDAEARGFVAAGSTPLVRAFRAAAVGLRAGKVLSKTNAEKLENAQDHHARALRHHESLGESHAETGDRIEKARAACRTASGVLAKAGEEASPAQIKRASAAVSAAGDHLDAAADAHAETGDSHRGAVRSIKAAQRCVRAVLGQSAESDDDGPEKPADDDDAATRARRARALALKHKTAAAAAAA